MDWITKNLAKAIAIAVFVLLIVGVLFLRQCSAERTAATRADLAAKQGDAKMQSGADAVSTTGNVQAAVETRQQTVKEANDAIDKAPAGNSNDAADRATCKLRSYRHSSKCIALLGPVAP